MQVFILSDGFLRTSKDAFCAHQKMQLIRKWEAGFASKSIKCHAWNVSFESLRKAKGKNKAKSQIQYRILWNVLQE
jgi:hypothetical protein